MPARNSADNEKGNGGHARDHLDHYRAQVGNHGGTVALTAIRDMLTKLVRKAISAKGLIGAQKEIPREFLVQFIVGAFNSVLVWWLDGGAKTPPELIDAMFQDLIAQGLRLT